MDFIEQLFGVSPDNGDGTTEILWLVVLASLLGGALFWKRFRTLAPRRSRRNLQERLGVEATIRERARFTCIARTPVGDLEAVIVTGSIDVTDVVGLIGAVVLIDGALYAVHDVASTAGPVTIDQPLMMKVRRL